MALPLASEGRVIYGTAGSNRHSALVRTLARAMRSTPQSTLRALHLCKLAAAERRESPRVFLSALGDRAQPIGLRSDPECSPAKPRVPGWPGNVAKPRKIMGKNAKRRRVAPTGPALNLRAVVSHLQQSAPQKTLLRGPPLGLSPPGRSLCMGCCTRKPLVLHSRTPSPTQVLTNRMLRVRRSGVSPAQARIHTTIAFHAFPTSTHQRAPRAKKPRLIRGLTAKIQESKWQALAGFGRVSGLFGNTVFSVNPLIALSCEFYPICLFYTASNRQKIDVTAERAADFPP